MTAVRLQLDSGALLWHFYFTILVSSRRQASSRRRVLAGADDNRGVAGPLFDGVLETVELFEVLEKAKVNADRVTGDRLELYHVERGADTDCEDGDICLVRSLGCIDGFLSGSRHTVSEHYTDTRVTLTKRSSSV